MPLKRKKKGEQEVIGVRENFVPLDAEDVKHLKKTVEVQEKQIDIKSLQTIETPGKIIKKKNGQKKKSKNNENIKTSKLNSNISLKNNGYELIITEKPQAADKIAHALGNALKRTAPNKVTYYEIEREGKKIVVGCAVGHLFTLRQSEKRGTFPVFDISWVPNYQVRRQDFSKRYYDTLLKLAKNAGSLTVATDYDIEGELIGINVVRYICNQPDAQRMKFSTLTKQELEKAYKNKSNNINWGQAIAGETRHYLDWFYGINLSRALMSAIKSTGSFKIMSIGRVQGPALNLIVQKEKEISAFKPETYWQVFITIDKNGTIIDLQHIKDLFNKSDLEKFKSLNSRTAEAETRKTEQTIPPLEPFNLTTLQIEAYKFYSITPARTLQIAQSLYLNGLISYPRTSSQKLPETIDYKDILKKIAQHFKAEPHIRHEKPVEGEKSDPAHPSIYPTGEIKDLTEDEEKIYNLIAKRFMGLFCDPAILYNKKINLEIDGLKFSTRGQSIKEKGWMAIYPSKMKERELPDINGEVNIIDLKNEEKQTQPPKRYSPASIVSELEKRNLGTKATRSSILETLYDRGYIREKSIEATPLGIALIESLEKYSPIIIDENLTREVEKDMEMIEDGKNKEQQEKKIVDNAKKIITAIAKDFAKNEKLIGRELVQGRDTMFEQEKEQNIIMPCPDCKKGNLVIKFARKTRRQFVACDNYPECRSAHNLPPNALIKTTGKTDENGLPILQALRKGKRPWEFSFDPKWREKQQSKSQENLKNNQQ
jgi:DNA topoisomerase-1